MVLLFGALVHIANIFGWGEQPRSATPPLWRTMDIVLVIFNVVAGVALWLKTPWGIIAFVAGIVAFQLIPYTWFREHFIQTAEHAAILNGMVVFWVVVLTALLGTVLWYGATR